MLTKIMVSVLDGPPQRIDGKSMRISAGSVARLLSILILALGGVECAVLIYALPVPSLVLPILYILFMIPIMYSMLTEWYDDIFRSPMSPLRNSEIARMWDLALSYPPLREYMKKLDVIGRAPMYCEYSAFIDFPDMLSGTEYSRQLSE